MTDKNGSFTPARRWVGVGRSSEASAFDAGRAAAGEALRGPAPKLVLVFASDAHDLEELARGISDVVGDTPTIGCSTAGEITADGPSTSAAVVMAFGGEGFSARTAVAEGASSRLREAGADVATALAAANEDHPHRVAMLLTDALGGDQQEVIRGAYSVFGAAIPLVGGCAGDDFKMKATFQFHNGTLLRDALVGAVLASESPLGVGVRHGWTRVGEPVLVTKSANNVVYTLDDKPALDVYLDKLDAPEHVRNDPAAFTQFSMTHPLGLGRRSAEEGARFVADANFEDRSLAMIAEVPEGGIAWFMEGDIESVLEATEGACQAALAGINGHKPIGILAFDCAARRLVLGDEGIDREVELIANHACGAPVAGFYSYGEIARTRGASGFHNETLVVVAVS